MSSYLMHYRMGGEKKGVRRYQYEDGSLTPEGRIHYGVGPARVAKDINRAAKEYKKSMERHGNKQRVDVRPIARLVNQSSGLNASDILTLDEVKKTKEYTDNYDRSLSNLMKTSINQDLKNAYSNPSFLKTIENQAMNSVDMKSVNKDSKDDVAYAWRTALDEAVYSQIMGENQQQWFPNVFNDVSNLTKLSDEYTSICEKASSRFLKEYGDMRINSTPELTNKDVVSRLIGLTSGGYDTMIGGNNGANMLEVILEEKSFSDSFPNKYPFNKYV